MEIYLIRHTKPLVEKGICYGQTDLDITDSFEAEAGIIKNILPDGIRQVYSSPLQRCSKLAAYLFGEEVNYHEDLMELHCGEWEMKHWDEIPKALLQPWMDNFITERVPGGESYEDLFARTVNRYEAISCFGWFAGRIVSIILFVFL